MKIWILKAQLIVIKRKFLKTLIAVKIFNSSIDPFSNFPINKWIT